MGKRCNICTGCGRCMQGHADGLKAGAFPDIVTEYGLPYLKHVPDDRCRKRLAVADIGTTTIAVQLYGRDGSVEADYVCVNPQIRYGADVLSRIRAAVNTQAANDMRVSVMDELRKALCSFRQYLAQDETVFMVLAGNTTMIYLLMGYDTSELGRAPFNATYKCSQKFMIDGVSCITFPCMSAFIGGDITAGIYACGMAENSEITLLLDLGTNGELVLGNRDRRIACATAAGPAFEGGVNRGVWGADMVRLTAILRKRGLLDETGLLADEYFDSGVLVGSVRVTQESIRAIQLAKGAIGAGIRILMKEYGIEGQWQRIDRVILAGGFGYYLDPEAAAVIGLLPAELTSRTSAGGNTALAGAARLGYIMLSEEGTDDADKTAGRVWQMLGIEKTEILNLAEHPRFESLYYENMNLCRQLKGGGMENNIY